MKKYGSISVFLRQMKEVHTQGLWYMDFAYFIGCTSSALATVTATLFTKSIIDIFSQMQDVQLLTRTVIVLTMITIIGFGISAFLEGVCNYGALKLRCNEWEKCSDFYRNVDYEKLEDPEFQDRFSVGLDALQSDGEGFQAVYTNTYKMLTNIFVVVLCAVILYKKVPEICLGFVLFTIFASISNYLYSSYVASKKEIEKRQYRQTRYFNKTLSDFNYGKDIRIFSLRDFLLQKYREVTDKYLNVVKDIQNHYILYGIFTVIAFLLVNSISYYCIYQKYLVEKISLSDAVLYFNLVAVCSTTLITLVSKLAAITKDLKSSSIYYETFDEENEKEIGTMEALDKNVPVDIVFDHVWFKYPHSDTYVLKDFSLEIKAGEKIAIVGGNGAGKSTIVKLLTGLYKVEKGKIYLNGILQTSFKKEAYFNMFSTVFQDFEIYPCTLLENVCGNEKDANKIAFAKKCIDAVGLKEKIESLPEGYNSIASKVIDEKGIDLSGGQKQKLAIARALYKQGNVIILDEPTAALDALAEAEIYQSFGSLVENKTAVYISHRLSSTKFCDHIALIDENGLQEYGTHEELMELHGKYYAMFKTQGKYYQDGGDDYENIN